MAKYKKLGGTMRTDTINIQGFGTNYGSSPVEQWQPFDLCVYGTVDPHLPYVDFLEQIVHYLDNQVAELNRVKIQRRMNIL